jgi:predicted RNA-binding protein with TRAM domain
MPTGEIEKREVVIPEAKSGQTWKVTFDNIKKTYSTNKLN